MKSSKEYFKLFLSLFLIEAVKCVLAKKDSDLCLQKSEAWIDDRIDGRKWKCVDIWDRGYCFNWQKDTHRCCPKTCFDVEGGVTEDECKALNGSGKCAYPFPAVADECYEGKKS